VIAASLFVILIALAVLTWIDILEILALSKQQYNVGLRESKLETPVETTSLTQAERPIALDDSDELVEEINKRLQSGERPLQAQARVSRGRRLDADREGPAQSKSVAEGQWPAAEPGYSRRGQSPILTHANYLYNPPPSPRSVSQSSMGNGRPEEVRLTPTRGVLKKSSSIQRIDSELELEMDEQGEEEEEEEELGVRDYQRQMQRNDSQSRRSLLNVRFAE